MNFATIKKYDVANGPGVRVSLFVSGCGHRCKGCFNAEAWDFAYGSPYTAATEEEILSALGHSYIAGLSLLGGEPFDPRNQETVCGLLKKVKERFPQKDVWCYTGYTLETDLQEGGAAFTPFTKDMLARIDVLVDGEFVGRGVRGGAQRHKAAFPRFVQSAHHRLEAHARERWDKTLA